MSKIIKLWEQDYLKMGSKELQITVYLEEGNRKLHMKNGKNYLGREFVKIFVNEVI